MAEAHKPGELLADGVAFWARATEHFWHNAARLWQLPMELVYAEDPTLGVMCSSVYFPPPKPRAKALTQDQAAIYAEGALINLTCTHLEDVGKKGVVAGAAAVVTVEPGRFASAKDPQAVTIRLKAGTPAGVYRVTLQDRDSKVDGTYVLPFGVPEPGP